MWVTVEQIQKRNMFKCVKHIANKSKQTIQKTSLGTGKQAAKERLRPNTTLQ